MSSSKKYVLYEITANWSGSKPRYRSLDKLIPEIPVIAKSNEIKRVGPKAPE